MVKRSWCVLQVLVVWDVSISRARNYRLFEEVQLKKKKKNEKKPSYLPHLFF